MSSSQDRSNPLQSVLSTLKNRIKSEKADERKWEEQTGTLAGDEYPELNVRIGKQAPEPRAEESEEMPLDDQLKALIGEGYLRSLDSTQLGPVFVELLNRGLLALFIQSVDSIRGYLESTAPEDRRWALESVRALISLEDLSLVPYGTLPLLQDCVGRVLVKEERVELRDAALEITAHLLGIEAVQGELEIVHSHLVWLERTARARGPEYTSHILASRALVLPPLDLFFKEGHAVLEDRVLPFFRFVGESGARSLTQLLDEENSRPHRKRILELLKLLGPLSIPALKEGLVAGSWHLVRNALNLVGELEEPQAFEYIVPCLEHPDPRVVHAAIRALWKTGGTRAARYLLDLLPGADGETQAEILQGLGHIGAAEAIPALGALAASAPENLRVLAIETLGQIKHQDALPSLEAQLKRKGRIFKTSEPLPVRLAAARALLSIGTMEARRILDQVVSDEPKGPDQEALRKVATNLNGWG